MEISLKSNNKNLKLNEINTNKFLEKIFSFYSETDDLFDEEHLIQSEKTVYEFSPLEKTKQDYDSKNLETKIKSTKNLKKEKNFKKKKEMKQKQKLKILYENIKDTSFNEIKEINCKQNQNIENKNQNSLRKSPKINSIKENESENTTTSFATDNNLSPIVNSSFNVNSVERFEKNQNVFIKPNNYLCDFFENSICNLNTKQYYDNNELKLLKNYNKDIFFPNDSQIRKKNNKKKKKRKNINFNYNKINDNTIITNGNNIINQLFVNRFEYHNIYNNIFSHLNSNMENYNNYSNINYNNNKKTTLKNNSILSKSNILSNLKNQKNSKSECIEKNYEEKKFKKKYIYMSDILSCPPIKINQKCTKPFIMNNQDKKKEILLNIKIKKKESDNYIELPIREEEDPILILENLQLDLNEIQKKKIIKDIEYSLHIIKHFNNLYIENDSLNIINKIKNNMNCKNIAEI